MVTINLSDEEAIMVKSILAMHYDYGAPGIRPRLYAEMEAFKSLYQQLKSVSSEGDLVSRARERLDKKWLSEHSFEESDWSDVEGAEVLFNRLGWWPGFHDAQLLWAKIECPNGDHRLEMRFELNESGPRDRFTMVWKDVDIFDVDGWDHQTTEVFFSDSLLKKQGHTWHFSLTGGHGNWTVVGGPIWIIGHENGPGEKWTQGD